jgi:hypothetical protein
MLGHVAGRMLVMAALRCTVAGNATLHWRWACPKCERQTCHEFALHSIGFSEWARACVCANPFRPLF